MGGVILFTRNYESHEQLRALVADIRAARETPLLIAVDHEGGRVQRFRPGFTELPPARWIGQCYHADAARGRALAREMGWLMARELRHFDIDISFAPVLDVDHGTSEVIGDRAFDRDPEVVAHLGFEWVRGMREAGMAATGKHFPGHGYVAADSHHALPVDEREFAAIERRDLLPFRRLIRAGLDAIMPAHVIYPAVDSVPAGFSPIWLREILRRRLGFEGVIFSDDLDMAAAGAGGGFCERADHAIDAGCDMVLVCNNRAAAIEVAEHLGGCRRPTSMMRRVRMQGHGHDEPAGAGDRWRRAMQVAQSYRDGGLDELELEVT